MLATSAPLLEEMIDRHLNGAELDEPLAGLLRRTQRHMERIDFLGAYRLDLLAAGVDAGTETWGDQPEASFPLLFGWAGFLNKGEPSTIYFHSDFETPAQAKQATEQAKDWPTEGPVGKIRQDGQTLIFEAAVPDEDVPGLVLGD